MCHDAEQPLMPQEAEWQWPKDLRPPLVQTEYRGAGSDYDASAYLCGCGVFPAVRL